MKTNLGHLESAAGIAGTHEIGTVDSAWKNSAKLYTSKIRVVASSGIVFPWHVPTKLEAWNRRGRSRIGGVSSFGFSGTNAHVIVEEYRADLAALKSSSTSSAQSNIAAQPYLFPISAKSVPALHAIAGRLHRYISISSIDSTC